MEASGHFIFELFKIAILSTAYTALVLLIKSCFLLSKNRKGVLNRQNFSKTYFIIYGLLFAFSFTYYGDHGLGDEYKIPLGHRETMSAGDLYAYFIPKSQSNQIAVQTFQVKDDMLCAVTDSGYLVYNLNTGNKINFVSERQYIAYAVNHQLPTPNLFLDFFKHYQNYWGGWRFWTMP